MTFQSLKVKDKKVSFFLDFRPKSRDMSISSFEDLDTRFKLSSEEEIANISAPRPQTKKARTLCYLKLQSLKERKGL